MIRLHAEVAVATFEFNNANSDREMYEASVRRENALRAIRRRQEALRKKANPASNQTTTPAPQPAPSSPASATEKTSFWVSEAGAADTRKSGAVAAGQAATEGNEATRGLKGSHAWILPVLLSLGLLVFGYMLHQLYQSTQEREHTAATAIKQAEARSAEAGRQSEAAAAQLARSTRLEHEVKAREEALTRQLASLAARERDLDARARSLDARESALNSQPPLATQSRPTQAAPPVVAGSPANIAANAWPRQNDDIAACDRLAANPTDTRRPQGIAGTKWLELRASASSAVAACGRALEANGSDPRLKYQLGRALQASGRYDEAIRVLGEAVQQQYPAAFDNLAQVYLQRSETARAITILRGGVVAGDPDSMVHLAKMIEARTAVPIRPNEADELWIRAATLGHEDAAQTVAQRQAAGQFINVLGTVFRGLQQR